eukprot:TRINITY_DN30586_c0_g1_i2.p1 TRINITY_DN30586_c0_g1~~TRINITY_DN30586_c0_g1_i2.p1  ORF type:complete len:560 (-),score=121.17 TRINITY_DN30586_c0_g1_i2:182-1861(-)
MEFVQKLLDFEQKFHLNCLEAQKYSKSWYKERVLQQLKENPPLSDDLTNCPADSVFVLGPEESVREFTGHDWRIWRELLTRMHPFPCAQAHNEGWLYHSDQVYKFIWERSPIIPLCELKTSSYDFPETCKIVKPHQHLDLYYSYDLVSKDTRRVLQRCLDELANETNDFFIQNYQNIIDPNLSVAVQPDADLLDEMRIRVQDRSNVLRWLATDFLVENSERSPSKVSGKISSPISNLDPSKYKELYVAVESIFNAAIPLLSKLRRPLLLLPGKVQCVMKAQRIYLQPGEEYSGVWHCDGKNEDIVAVILYYYRISEKLEGGDLEFIDKKPKTFWLSGDCYPDSFTNEEAKEFVRKGYCRVPVKSGTLVVFSNYQLVHRVLTMQFPDSEKGDPDAPGGLASRDFLAFFVVDQRSPLSSTSNLVKKNERERRIAFEKRRELFLEQIQPTGSFGIDESVHSTGNGSVALLGWVQNNLDSLREESVKEFYHRYKDRSGLLNLILFNQPPPISRGISWALENDEALFYWRTYGDDEEEEENDDEDYDEDDEDDEDEAQEENKID